MVWKVGLTQVETKEKRKIRDALHYAKHREERIEYAVEYAASHPKERLEYERKYRMTHPDKTKAKVFRHHNKRRRLGSTLLNKPFVGCEGHHIDEEQVINMPKKLHRSVYHCLSNGQGMAQINAIAYNFLFKQEAETALKREMI